MNISNCSKLCAFVNILYLYDMFICFVIDRQIAREHSTNILAYGLAKSVNILKQTRLDLMSFKRLLTLS